MRSDTSRKFIVLLIWGILVLIGFSILISNKKIHPLTIGETVTDIGDGKALIPCSFATNAQAAHMTVLFGRKEAKVVNVTENGIIVQVPPSDYKGIAWDVSVGVTVRTQNTQKLLQQQWTYPATIPPTKVANTALFWFTANTSFSFTVIKLFADRLGIDWRFQIFVFEECFQFAASNPMIQDMVNQGRMFLVKKPRQTRLQYARQCVDSKYWESVHGDRILAFQLDSTPCSGADHNISDFFDYDYLGAPWPYYDFGGNGGLSLRNRTALIRLINENPEFIFQHTSNPKWYQEDVVIGLFPHSHTHF